MKLKNFCTAKEMVTRLKRKPTEWEKIFASYAHDKELLTSIYMELKKLNSQLNQQCIYDLNRNFSKEEVQEAKNHMMKCSTSLAIKEIQIKPQ
jgi:hypothetical protein